MWRKATYTYAIWPPEERGTSRGGNAERMAERARKGKAQEAPHMKNWDAGQNNLPVLVVLSS